MLKVYQYRAINSEVTDGVFEKMIHLVSVVNDLDPIDVQYWSSSKLVEEYTNSQRLTKISERYSSNITIGGVALSLLDFRNLSLGQFIDLEKLVSDGFHENIHKISASIYLSISGGGMLEQEIEPYEKVNIEYRSNLIDELPINQIYGACLKYLSFRESFFNSYDIFNDPYADVDPNELSEDERAEYDEEMKEREKHGKNQWATLLNVLSDKDVTKFNDVLKLNLFLTFNQVSWLKSNK